MECNLQAYIRYNIAKKTKNKKQNNSIVCVYSCVYCMHVCMCFIFDTRIVKSRHTAKTNKKKLKKKKNW